MERETKEFETGGKNKVIYKTYITGRESNEIQSIYLKDTKVNMIGQEIKVEGFDPASEYEANKKMLELLIVSLNGSTDNVADRILDLPNNEYQEILGTIKIISGEKKK